MAADANRTTKTIVLKDDWGDSHSYETIMICAEDSIDMVPTVIKLTADPLSRAVGAFAGGKPPAELLHSLNSVMGHNDDTPEIGGINGDALASAFIALAEQLHKAGGARFFKELLKTTTRDGKGCDKFFNEFYTGNLGECFHAVGWVLYLNFKAVILRPFDHLDLSRIATLVERDSPKNG